MIFLVITVLAIFYMASAFNQIKYFSKSLAKYDKLQLLPNYCFFAPTPYQADFRLVYKVNDEDDSNWEELDMYEEYSIKRIFWHPFKYYNKGMIDLCQMLVKESRIFKDKDRLKASTNHINIVLSIYRYLLLKNRSFDSLKFAIVTSMGAENLKITSILFDSNYQNI